MSEPLFFQDIRFPGEEGTFSFSISAGTNRLLPTERKERDVLSFLFPAGTEGKLIAEGKEYDLSRPGDACLFLLEARFREGGSLSALLPVGEKEGARIAKELLSFEDLPYREKVRGTMSLLKERGALYFIVEEWHRSLLDLVRNLYPPFGGTPLLILGEEAERKKMPENQVRFRSGSLEREPFRKDALLNAGEYLFQALFMFIAVSLSLFGVCSLVRGEGEGLIAGVCLAVAFLVLLVFLNSVRSSLSLLLKLERGPMRIRRISLLSGLAGSVGCLLAFLMGFVMERTSFLGGFLDGFGDWSLFLSFLGVLLSFLLPIGVSGAIFGRKKHA